MRTIEWDEGLIHVATRMRVRRGPEIPCDLGKCNETIKPGQEYIVQIARNGNELMMDRTHIFHYEKGELDWWLFATLFKERRKRAPKKT